MEPIDKKQQQEDDEENVTDLLHPLDPHAPTLLPLAEKQSLAPLDLEASRSRCRTHSEVSEAPTVAYPDYTPDVLQQNGQEGSSAQGEQPAAVPAAASRSSSVPPTEFYSDIAHALQRAQAQVGD